MEEGTKDNPDGKYNEYIIFLREAHEPGSVGRLGWLFLKNKLTNDSLRNTRFLFLRIRVKNP